MQKKQIITEKKVRKKKVVDMTGIEAVDFTIDDMPETFQGSFLQFLIIHSINKNEWLTRHQLMKLLDCASSTMHENLNKLVAKKILNFGKLIREKKGHPEYFYFAYKGEGENYVIVEELYQKLNSPKEEEPKTQILSLEDTCHECEYHLSGFCRCGTSPRFGKRSRLRCSEYRSLWLMAGCENEEEFDKKIEMEEIEQAQIKNPKIDTEAVLLKYKKDKGVMSQ